MSLRSCKDTTGHASKCVNFDTLLQDNSSTVILDPVEFGEEGPWALSLWFCPTPLGLVGDQFEYLFSQGNADTAYLTGYEPNQVRPIVHQLSSMSDTAGVTQLSCKQAKALYKLQPNELGSLLKFLRFECMRRMVKEESAYEHGCRGACLDHTDSAFSSSEMTLSVCLGLQIRLYFPQLGHPGFDIIRALVRDSYDEGSEPATRTFLDSDGLIGQVLRNQTTPALDNGATLLQVDTVPEEDDCSVRTVNQGHAFILLD